MISAIEDAILARFAAVNDGRLGYKVASLESYGGEFDDELAEVVRRLPGIWVVFAGTGKPEPWGTSRVKWRVPCTFAVLVGARSVRAEPFSRRGLERADGAVVEVGSYRLLEDARKLLMNQDFGLPISPLALGQVKTLYNTRLSNLALSVFSQEWHTSYIVQSDTPADADWLRLMLQYDLVPPGDGIAEASDSITLK